MIIYKATNKINSKCYIGKTIKTLAQRKGGHVYEAKNNINDFVFHKAIMKYGINNFEWETIKECKSIKEMDTFEEYFINKFDSFYGNGFGYNMIKNGSSGMRGKKWSAVMREKREGYKHSPKTIEKIRQSSLRQYKDKPNFTMTGRKHTEETKKLQREKSKGNTRRAKKWKFLLNGDEKIIKNLVKWCKENNYSYQKARWRIRNNTDFSLPTILGRRKKK